MPDPVPDIDRFMEDALALPDGEFAVNVPLHVFHAEAIDVAAFHEMYWKPSVSNGKPLPGLESAVRRGVPSPYLGPSTGEEILSLSRATHELRNRYHLAAGITPPSPLEQARELVRELVYILDYAVDDGVSDDLDAQLAAIHKDHANDPDSTDAIALQLEDYGRFAKSIPDRVDGLAGFEIATADLAIALAAELRSRPAIPSAQTPKVAAALDLRNRFLTLLLLRVSTVRSAAAVVFRNHPEIVRLATSRYGRHRKAMQRAAKKGEPVAE